MRNIPMNLEFNILSQNARELIHGESLRVLKEIGIKVTGAKMLNALEEHGCEVSCDGNVKIPESLVNWALKCCTKEFDLYNRDGEAVMHFGKENNIYFGVGTQNFDILDHKTNQSRPYERKDLETICKVTNQLPNIHSVISVGNAPCFHPEEADQLTFLDILRYSVKQINPITQNIQSLKDILEVSKEFMGGLENMKAKPPMMYYAEPIPPLFHPEESNERLILCAEYGVPLVYMPYTMMGGTGPVTVAGVMTQNNADILAGLVMVQIFNEGLPYFYGSMPTLIDMKTTVGSYAAPEFHLGLAASAEMADYYGLPFYGTAGCSDARTIDAQCVSEIEMQIFASLLSKANFVHDLGLMDHCTSSSLGSMVLCNEIIEQLKNFIKGISVTEEDILFDAIKEVGPCGNFVTHDSTSRGFREHWYSDIFQRNMINNDDSQVLAKITSKIESLLWDDPTPALDQDRAEILDTFEKRFKK